MTKISFNPMGVGLFKSASATTPKETQKSTSSNPFGMSFRGNVIQADVFQTTANKINAISNIKEKGKMFMSAVVGSLNSFNGAIKSRVNSVVSFGRQVKDNVANWWEQAKATEITLDWKQLSTFMNDKFNTNPYSVNNLVKKPVSELSDMFKAELA